MFPAGELRAWVRDLGFPILVAGFVLWRLDTQVTTLVAMVVQQTESMRAIERVLRECEVRCGPAPFPFKSKGDN